MLLSFIKDTNKDVLGGIVMKKVIIPLLFQVLDIHSTHPDVCKMVCKTMMSFEINDLTKSEFFKKKRLNKIISVMKANSTNYDVITTCLFAINHAVTTIQREKQNIKEVTQNMEALVELFKATTDDPTTCSTFLNLFIRGKPKKQKNYFMYSQKSFF